MRLADIVLESTDIRQRYRGETYEFLTDLKTQLIDPKKAEKLIVEWLTDSKAVSMGMFLNDLRIFNSLNFKRYPAVVELVDSYKPEIIKNLLTILAAPHNNFLTSPAFTVQFNIDTVRSVGVNWPEFAAIERSINSKQIKENDYDDDDRTPDLKGAEQYIQDVKQDFDQFGGLPVNAVINDLTYRYNLEHAQMLQVLEPIKSDIVIYINTEIGRGGFSIYGAVRRIDKLHIANIDWPEIYRVLENHKHDIIRYMLGVIKNDNNGSVPGFITEMVIILTRMGVTWPELATINRSIAATKKLLPESVKESFTKEQRIEFAQKAFERGTVYGFWRLDLLDLKASEVPGAIEILNADKDRFISSLLRMLKSGDQTDIFIVKNAVKNYRHHGLNWPELDIIERSINHNKLTETQYDINSLTEPEQIERVKRRPVEYFDIKNPSEAVEIMTVTRDPFMIEYIHNPSEAVQLAAVKKGCASIQYISNPTERVQLAAVKRNGVVLQFIDNPSEKVINTALKSNAWAIKHVQNPTEQQKLIAVSTDGVVISEIENPSDAVINAALASNPRSIETIENSTLEQQISALSRSAVSIFHIKSVDPRVFEDPRVKENFMTTILSRIKNTDDIGYIFPKNMMRALENHGAKWPEFAVLKRSLSKM